MTAGSSPQPTGLRERKRLRTRQEISDVATNLFAEHGFERVTLAQIAAAAEVSVKTIFNYFGSKEDLYFDRADEFRDGFVATIVDRPREQTVLGALRELLTDNLTPFPGAGWAALDIPENYEMFRRFQSGQAGSPALQARSATLLEELGDHLTGVIGPELGREPDDVAIRTFAAMLMTTIRLRDRALRAAVMAELPPAEVRRRVVEVVDEAFARLEAAFGEMDRRAGLTRSPR